MDFLDDLESMASIFIHNEITPTDIARWQTLFRFSIEEARSQIEYSRSDMQRTSITSDTWHSFSHKQETLGHDKESFEFSLAFKTTRLPITRKAHAAGTARGTYIIKLEGPINTAECVQMILGTQHPPEVLKAQNQDTDAEELFCKVDARERDALVEYLAREHPEFKVTSVRLAKAIKELAPHTKAPCLGQTEWTMPPLRPTEDQAHGPGQDEYPVWYFFYGKLADTKVLRSVLGLEDDPIFVPATVARGRIRRWANKYNAMVDTGDDERVVGSAYLVTSKEHEEALAFFETDMYEVVRCSIIMTDGTVKDGLVFRYCGPKNSYHKPLSQCC